MALTATLTKQSVVLVNNIYNITLHCEIKDGEEVVWEGSGTGKYNPYNPDLELPKAAILAELKKKYDKWAEEQSVYNSGVLDLVVTELQSTVNAYINS